MSKEDLDQRRQTVKVDEATVDQALQQVYAIRVGLGLPAQPPPGKEPGRCAREDLEQNFSAVQQALGTLLQSAAQVRVLLRHPDSTPEQVIENFYKQDPRGNLDHILAHLIPNAPAIKQAEAKLLQARRDLEQAELNLRYCDIVSEIDGVVTSRNVNPGNNVQAGQSLMAVRSLTEIWIDANFKETQLADLRIGQRVRCEVDMYGGRREFEGRITGFTMGTGQTLALLPPQNATGNFVKIVQRLPVRSRADRLRPGQGPAVRRPVGHALRVLQGTGHGADTPGGVLQPLGRSSPSRRAIPNPSHANTRPPSPARVGPGARTMSTLALSHTAPIEPATAGGGQPLGRRCSRRRAHVHGDPGHDDRQRGACGTSPADCRRRRTTPTGSSPATWPPTRSSCRSPAGCRPDLGRRNYFLLSIAVFTLASAHVRHGHQPGQMILFRVIQGLAGGGLQPCSQGVLMDAFPAREAGHGHDAVRRRRHHRARSSGRRWAAGSASITTGAGSS